MSFTANNWKHRLELRTTHTVTLPKPSVALEGEEAVHWKHQPPAEIRESRRSLQRGTREREQKANKPENSSQMLMARCPQNW